eukprot:scaffold289103_cov35-Tisochrysis_lutea.AAC.6
MASAGAEAAGCATMAGSSSSPVHGAGEVAPAISLALLSRTPAVKRSASDSSVGAGCAAGSTSRTHASSRLRAAC